MKSKLSISSITLIGLGYLLVSLINFSSKEQVKVTTWDALGYYLYLPATVIYQDLDELKFYPEIEKKYQLQGKHNEFYQFTPLENGKQTGKYFVGISLLQSPFFFLAHAYASSSNKYAPDGFSAPYQISIILSALFYLLLGLFILQHVLRMFYNDKSTAISLLIIGFATNLIQYAAIDVGQSHIYLFFLYCLIVYLTIKWHANYQRKFAIGIGLCIGLATICRPTEIIMLFIPLLWHVNDKVKWKEKINKLFRIEKQLVLTSLGFVLLLLIQIIYWKYSTGHFIHNVGSKWHFLNPFFRVLFGFEKGWFIYTPITIFFIVGFFFMKKKPFKIAVIIFCLLNIWIVIAWFDWQYGASYSTRALVQSYPVFAFGLAAFISWVEKKKLRFGFYALVIYLIGVNLFQIYQYNTGILHFNKMNYEYYKRIYLNPSVKDIDRELLSD